MAQAWAEEASYVITIKEHKLDPSELEVPAGVEFLLVVKNADDTPEEFESEALDLEKIVPAGAEAQFSIGPLEPGSYDVVGEFHEDTARGKIIVK
jgi:plastocyanin